MVILQSTNSETAGQTATKTDGWWLWGSKFGKSTPSPYGYTAGTGAKGGDLATKWWRRWRRMGDGYITMQVRAVLVVQMAITLYTAYFL